MSTLNRFWVYFDPNTKEGISRYKLAITNFKSPLSDEQLTKLNPADEQQIMDTVRRLSQQFVYDFMMKDLPMIRVATPEPRGRLQS